MSNLRMDHVIYAVDDLDEAAAGLFDREGLGSVPGGRHEGWGTANRIVPLGDTYLELIAVVDVDEAEGSEFGRGVRRAQTEERPARGLGRRDGRHRRGRQAARPRGGGEVARDRGRLDAPGGGSPA